MTPKFRINSPENLARRKFLREAFAASLGAAFIPPWLSGQLLAADKAIHLRSIPATGEQVPAIGLGSWITFDVPPGDSKGRQRSTEVIRRFLAAGGTLIDSSPMYGHAQELIGSALRELDKASDAFSATKVWIPGASLGESQMEQALELWGLQKFDLLFVHNMLDWENHLTWMQQWQENGKLRYLGVSTSHGRRHAELADVIRQQPFEILQFTYNIADREAEKRLLPLAQEFGKAVVINRPFAGGDLFRRVRNRPLPPQAVELQYTSWAQVFLSWIISHPAVTCAIPATSNPEHLSENMAVLRAPLPDELQRRDMLDWFLKA